MKKLTASDAQAGDKFGGSVAVSGDTAVVGAYTAGAAYVFQRDQGGADNWGEVKKLTASDAEADDWFGYTVAVSGDTAIVGALMFAGGNDAGAAYVFQRDQGGADNWGEVKKLTASDAQAGDQFGVSVAVSGDTAVVGTIFKDAAYVVQRDEGGADNWGEVKKLSGAAGTRFGTTVAVSGDAVVVGAFLAGTGAAYLFQRDQGGADSWGKVVSFTASDASADDLFGISVAASGNTVVVGANGEAAFDTNAGAAYVFQTKLLEPGDTDGDGCSDQRENGIDETLGGQRDFKNPWDFYDVLGPGAMLPKDGVIDLPNDILSVMLHFSPTGYTPGEPSIVGNIIFDAFDRGPQTGANVWNMGPPDGVIDLPNDILGVILQVGHSCT